MRILNTTSLALITLCIMSCTTEEPERPKTAEELRAELKQQELEAPLLYLIDTSVVLQPQQRKVREAGFFRDAEYAPDGAIIKGTFMNKASLAKYKDVVVKVSFFSKTKTLIKEESYVLYEYYEPHSSKEFAMKLDTLPNAYVDFGFEVVDAKPVFE